MDSIKNDNEQVTSSSKEKKLIEGFPKKTLNLEDDDALGIMLNDALNLPLDKVNFNGMPIEFIIYIIENNKNGGNLVNNPDISYLLDLAKQDILLAKILVTKFRIDLGDNLFPILDYILSFEPNYKIDINSLNILEVIQSYLRVGKLDLVEEYISQISLDDLLLPFKYDNNKTILQVIIENETIDCFEDRQFRFILKNERAAIILLNNEWFSNILLEILESNEKNRYIEILLNTLIHTNNGILLANFVSKNFDRVNLNYYLRMNASSNKNLTITFMEHGVFSPFHKELLTLPRYNGLTILDYALSRYKRGENIDLGIDFFNQKMIESLNGKYSDYIDYVTIYCNHQYFEPFSKVNIESLTAYYNNGQSVLEYIFSVNPKFEMAPRDDSSFSSILINEYISVGNFEAISQHLKYFQAFFLKYMDDSNVNNEKLYIDIFMENNVNFDESTLDILSSMIAGFQDDYLLSKNQNGITLLERLLKFNIKIGEKLAFLSVNCGKKVSPQIAVILAKYGLKSMVDCDDQYTRDFEQYINELILSFDRKTNFSFYVKKENMDNEVLNLLQSFSEHFRGDSDEKLILIVSRMFLKYLEIDKQLAIQYLNSLIKMKEQNPGFKLKYNIENESRYLIDVVVNSYNRRVLSHEIGHAVHSINADKEYPEHLRIMIERLKNNPETLEKMELYAKYVQQLIAKRRNELQKKFMDYIYNEYPGGYFAYSTKIRESYEAMVEYPEKLLATASARLGGGCDSDTLSKLLEGIPITFDEYKNMTMINDENEFVSRFIRYEFGSAFMIENLMDAIYEGRWNEGKLAGVTAKCYSGHDINYYKKKSTFEEIFANISGLMFDIITNNENVEKELRFLLGDDLCDALIEYYHQLNQSQGKAK